MELFNVYSLYPVEPVRGKGCFVYDAAGTEYLDLYGGHAVISIGHAQPDYVRALSEQAARLGFYSNSVENSLQTTLAEKLGRASGYDDYSLFLCNSGAEANECAIKAARKCAQEEKGKEYYNIITLKYSFHGRTVTTLAATGQDAFHKDFTPLTEGFLYADANDFDSVKALAKEHKCAAIMFEPVQGEGGVMPLDKEFLEKTAAFAKENGILLVADEVQTGNGRTGKLYGYMHYNIEPDIFSTAKGLGGGLPIGATVMTGRVAAHLTPGTHGSTFGGNPICAAGALTVIERLTDSFLSEVGKKGDYIKSELSGAKGVKSVSGLGLMVGLKTEKSADEVIACCREHGVIAIKAKDRVRLLPALNIPEELLKKAVSVIKEACE